MTKVERVHPGMNFQKLEDKTHVGQRGEVIQEGKRFDTVCWENGKVEEVYKGDLKKLEEEAT